MKKKRRHGKRIYILMLIFALMLFVTSNLHIRKRIYNIINNKVEFFNFERNDSSSVNVKLYSPYAILVELDNNKILMEKSSSERIYPASLTKIMTAIIAIENIQNLNQKVTLNRDMFNKLYQQDASMAGFRPNESVSAMDLLYGVLLPSGAEASVGLADYAAGSEDKFVSLMNQKAQKLGMKQTHFTNVCGLHNNDHYSTVKDLSILLRYALRNRTFREIFTAEKHSTEATNMHPNGITFYSTMFKSLGKPDFNGGRILGGKTGFTSEAGLCLASLAIKNGKEYILVTAGAKGDHDTKQYDILDAINTYGKIRS